MYRLPIFLLYCLFSLPILSQGLTDTLTAVVLDAETREPVPYASVYVSPACGTISNYEGEFRIACLPSEAIRISSIGYLRANYCAAELPDTVLLAPIATTMRELTVLASDDILSRLIRKMQKEARKYKHAVGNYFFRITTQYPGTDELAEAFMSANSCIQLRELTFHSGTHGLLKDSKGNLYDTDLKGLGNTNLHIFLQLAPISLYYGMWDVAILPSDIVTSRNGALYNVSYSSFFDEDGTEIRKVTLSGKPASSKYNILEGTLYIDYKKCRLLRFDGRMRGLNLYTYDNARRRRTADTVQYSMHVDYHHDHGFTEVANMSGTLVKDKVQIRFLLFNLMGKELSFSRSVKVGDNMMSAIDRVGFDSSLWTTSEIVKRTKLEERIAFGDTTFQLSSRSNYNTEPSQQEAAANAFLRRALHELKGDAMPLHRGQPEEQQVK